MSQHWTEADYQKVVKKWGRGGVVGTASPSKGVRRRDECNRALISAAGSNPAPSPYASKWELNYAKYLDLQQKAGEIISWRYGRVTFRLAKGQYHRIDFIVLRKDLRVQMDQVKGWHPNLRAAIKGLKWAAQLWPMFYWTITKWNGLGWESTDVEV